MKILYLEMNLILNQLIQVVTFQAQGMSVFVDRHYCLQIYFNYKF